MIGAIVGFCCICARLTAYRQFKFGVPGQQVNLSCVYVVSSVWSAASYEDCISFQLEWTPVTLQGLRAVLFL